MSIEKAIKEWIAQGGREEENIWGVRNFVTSKPFKDYEQSYKDQLVREIEKIAEIHEEGQPFKRNLDSIDFRSAREYLYVKLDEVLALIKDIK